MKGEPYRRITPTALARNAPPQSGLRPASSTFYGIAATGSYIWFHSLRDAPPGGEAFYSYYRHLVMLSLDFFFSHSFQNLWKRIPIPPKHCFSIFFSVNQKNSTGLSLSVEFFPSIPFLKRFQPLLWHLKTSFSLAFPGISPQAIQTLWKHFCSRGGGVENRKGAERRVFPGFRPLWGWFSAFFTGCNRFSTWFIHSCGNSCG